MRTDRGQYPINDIEGTEALAAETLFRRQLGQRVNNLRDRQRPCFVVSEGSNAVAQVNPRWPQLGQVRLFDQPLGRRIRVSAVPLAMP